METEEHKLQQILSEHELRAIDMKYEGYNMREIATELNEKHNSVRQWFMRGGKLYDFYIGYATEESERRKQAARDTFKAHLQNAVRVLVEVMNKSKFDPARVQAAKEIINRQLGEPVKPIELVNQDRVNEYLEAVNKLEKVESVEGNGSRREDSNSSTS